MEGEVEEDGVTQEEEHHGVEVGADHLVPGADEVVQAVRQVLPHHHLPHPLQRPAEGKVLSQQLKGHPQNSTFVLKSKLVAGVKYVSSFGRFSLYLWRCGEGELWTGHFSRISFSQAQHRLCRMHLKLYFKVKRRLGYFYVCKTICSRFSVGLPPCQFDPGQTKQKCWHANRFQPRHIPQTLPWCPYKSEFYILLIFIQLLDSLKCFTFNSASA